MNNSGRFSVHPSLIRCCIPILHPAAGWGPAAVVGCRSSTNTKPQQPGHAQKTTQDWSPHTESYPRDPYLQLAGVHISSASKNKDTYPHPYLQLAAVHI